MTYIIHCLESSLFIIIIIIRDQLEVVVVRVEFQPKNVTIVSPSLPRPFALQPDMKCVID